MTVVIPEPMTRFACNQRGCCCKGWTIPFRPADVARLASFLPADERQERLQEGVYIQDPLGKADQLVLQTVGPDRACTFLEGEGTCEVHRRFGMEALPRLCVNFPAVPFTAGDRVEMHFSLVCPEVLERVAEGAGPYEIASVDASRVAARADRITGSRYVKMGDVDVPWDRLHAIRDAILAALDDTTRPLLEVAADVCYALGKIERPEQLETFEVAPVADRQAFYDFFATSIRSHAPPVLAANLRSYRRFVFDLDMDDPRLDEPLERALADWEADYRRWVLPTIPEWLLRRYLSHRYFTVFTNGAGELTFSYGSIVHAFALACRLMAGLCGALERQIDVPIAKCAIGAAEYFHRQLERQLPPEAMPWFVP